MLFAAFMDDKFELSPDRSGEYPRFSAPGSLELYRGRHCATFPVGNKFISRKLSFSIPLNTRFIVSQKSGKVSATADNSQRMTSPPVLRLSQALYTDAPKNRFPSCRTLSTRKRSLKHRQTMTNCSYPLRMLLPRTFALAERAYHVGGHISDIIQDKDNDLRCPCQDGIMEPSTNINGRPFVESGGDGEKMFPPDMHTRVRDCGMPSLVSGVQCPEGGPSVTAMGMIVVVESVIGFMTLRSLLERSHRSRMSNWRAEEGGNEDGIDKQAGTDAGVSEVLGRLVGWLRLAAVMVKSGDAGNLPMANYQISSSGVSGGDFSSTDIVYRTLNVSKVPRKWRDRAESEEGSPLLPNDGDVYEVTGWCDSGSEWSVFSLESPGRDSEGPVKSPCARGVVLDVKLICHPLVTMVPDLRWGLRLLRQAKAIATLHNVNAKLSTLGGGYYLTRQVAQAIQLARAQSKVAKALGDVKLAGKCRINEAYNYIWLGQYGQAQRIIHAQVTAARVSNDVELETVATTADRFLLRARKANRRLLKGYGGGEGEHKDSSAGRSWTPQRIDVKTDEWHRVRALSMYCST